jgi:predicted nucleic acid-binding protein
MTIEIATGRLATTAINAFELRGGARTPAERGKVEILLEALHVLGVDGQAAALAASARRDLEARGMGIGLADYLIAGVCMARSGMLLTRNQDYFRRIPGLVLGTVRPQDDPG